MSMRVHSRSTLIAYWAKNPAAQGQLEAWYDDTVKSTWTSPDDVKKEWPKASIVANDRVVFNICGGDYRLVVGVAYGFGSVYVKFIGTHNEYNKIKVATVEP